ncbi:MAG: hypothetical protein K6E62_05845, partial [Lachnospiraceae bacterium]|nr:hypothetical protein [Lachnospiraceae bacterium]
MNVFRGSKRKMILIIAAVIMVMAIIFFVWKGKKAGEPAEIQNNAQNGAGGGFSEYGIGGDREYPEGIIVLEPGDDYNVMLSDRGLLSSEGSLSAVGGALNPTEGAAAVSAKESASTTTVLVYCIGSDLESENGCATADLREMIESGIGKAKNVNLIIQTGGTKTWKNNAVSAGRLERFRILRDGMYLLEDAEQKSMVDPDTLSEFISWGADKFPADRMCMIIWGRGGGAVSGIGGDEFHEGSLKLTDIDAAFTKAGVHFDFVGFDASLMGTVETAYMLRSHADNMIASQEAEPGGGWYYTGWLRLLAADPAIGTDILAKQLADDMVRYSATCGQAASLSAVRLDRIQGVYSQICSFLANVKTAAAGSDFARIANALSGSGISGDGLYDQTDIVEFALNTG